MEKQKRPRRKTHKYINNKYILEKLSDYKKDGVITNELGEVFMVIAKNLSNKNNFSGYTWKDEMISEAVLTCVKYIKNFNPEKSQNPFAYITQICYNSFRNYIKKQKRHGDIKQTLFDKKIFVEEDISFAYKSIDYTLLK